MRWWSRTHQLICRKYARGDRSCPGDRSNLGRLDLPAQYGSLKLEAFYGPAMGCNPEEVVLGAVTVGDKAHFAMTFTDLTLTAPQAEEIKAKAMEWLADATRW